MIRVLVVDDSAVVRKVLQARLSQVEGIDVVDTACDPFVARDKIVRLKPDVLTLDIEMPRMDGLTFLRKLMRHHPMPVVILSSLTQRGGQLALNALAEGAVDVMAKPSSAYSVERAVDDLALRIRAAAVAKGQIPSRHKREPKAARLAEHVGSHQVLALGASTGGTVALEKILRALPANLPGTVVTQHMPPGITRSFAQRLDQVLAVTVREARDGDPVTSGQILIAPGDQHMMLRRDGARFRVSVRAGPRVNHHRPSVDVLFRSVARHAGTNAVGVILTGMGGDGAKGLREMREAGARTLAQDEASCVVYGMPKVAVELGAVEQQAGLDELPSLIVRALESPGQATPALRSA